MRRNYKRYCDVLYFDFFDDQIKSYCEDGRRHSLATFTVFDCNMRALLVGFAVITYESAETIALTFELLFGLNEDKQPKAVNIKRNSQTVQAFHYL
jgi:hypothetical protein